MQCLITTSEWKQDRQPVHAAKTATGDSRTLVVDLCSAFLDDGGTRHAEPNDDAVLIADGQQLVSSASASGSSFDRVVVFLPRKLTRVDLAAIDNCVALVAQNGGCPVCLVSSYRVEVCDEGQRAAEDAARDSFEGVARSVVLLRTGNVLGPHTRLSQILSRLAPLHPLMPESVRSVFISADELFRAVNKVTRNPPRLTRRYTTLLGRNRALHDVLAEMLLPNLSGRAFLMFATVLSWLQIGRFAGLAFAVAARFFSSLRWWRLTTLQPQSVGDLLALYNPLNQRHVALAGYNTGVTHFGWKYPDRTVVRTTASGKLVRVREKNVEVDAGVLLKRVTVELSARGKELFVLPNYSYISMGTTFMVPVHGSGSEVSTLGDTIERVLVYDPADDRLKLLRRGDELFGRAMYNPSSGLLVLRLRIRIKQRSQYSVMRTRLESPNAAEIWAAFTDPDASNVELRKSRAADSIVEVSKYYATVRDDPQSLELPRDSIGRLWDRLEENPVTSWLLHTYVRRFGFHVELFLDAHEFDVFWRAHDALPLSKIQLRLVKRDGLSHSPFRESDRISVDIFMKRKDRGAFLSFMKEHLPGARFNPGKHSM